MGILTVGIVTTPFWFEGKARYSSAMDGIDKLKESVDTLLIINNDKIRDMYGNLTRREAFNHANNILATAAKSISEIITVPGEINVDFADVQTVMKNGGSAIMGSATAEGTDRALTAAQGAINSPLLNDSDIRGAKKVLVNITTGTKQVTMDEIGEIMEYVQESAGSTDIILGACDDPSIGEKLSVTIIATGFESSRKPAYTEQKVVKVYELTDKPVVNETPVVEQQEEVLNKVETETPVVDEVVQNIIKLEEEETFTLFTSTTEETVSENTIEFEVTREEQKLEEATEEVVEQKDETTVEPVVQKEEYVVYTKKSYESDAISTFPQEELSKQLDDRKKILAGLSYRFGNKQNVNELENEPAYKRKGLELEGEQNFSSNTDVSRYSVGDNGGDRPEIKKNNSFLHDNVD
jgi:cell division protein FtsZ